MFSTDGCTFPETFYLGWFSKRKLFLWHVYPLNLPWKLLFQIFFFFFSNFPDILNDPGAKKAREVVFSALQESCTAGDLSIQEALTAATDMFAKNAKAFYKLNASEKQFNSTTFASPKNITEERHSPEEDCILVRLMWMDTSGQLRCRVSL